MAYALEQVLGYVSLGEMIETVKAGIPNPLPPAFFTTTEEVLGDAARYMRVTGSRRVPKLAQYGAPAIRRELRDIGSFDVKLMHLFEEQPIPPLLMQKLRNYNDYNNMRMGLQEVQRQVEQFVQNFQNMRIAASLLMLAYGQLGFDSAGNLLPNSGFGGAYEQIVAQVPSTNQGQLTTPQGSTIIPTGQGWQVTATDIPKQIRTIKQAAVQLTGYPIKYALYGLNVPSYLEQNDYVVEYMARSERQRTKFLDTADVPADLFDIEWIPAYYTFFEDQNGTVQPIVGNDQVIFFPEISKQWWGMYEGSYTVPTNINIVTDAKAAMDNVVLKYGMFGYGQLVHNPPTVMTYYGDTFLPVIKNGQAIWQATVLQ